MQPQHSPLILLPASQLSLRPALFAQLSHQKLFQAIVLPRDHSARFLLDVALSAQSPICSRCYSGVRHY